MAIDLAFEATLAQRRARYRADTWVNVQLRPMMKLWRGVDDSPPEDKNFFFSEEDAREAKGAYAGSKPLKYAQTFWRLAQVRRHGTLDFRVSVEEFVVDLPTMAAIGICRANREFGSGSVLQYYVPDWQKILHPTGNKFQFPANPYPPSTALGSG